MMRGRRFCRDTRTGPLLLLFLFVWRMVQDYVISPRVMGVSVELHPLAALFGILAGRRNCRNARRLSLHPGDGQFAHRLAALAHLRRKAQVRTAQRVLVPARVGKRKNLARSGTAEPVCGEFGSTQSTGTRRKSVWFPRVLCVLCGKVFCRGVLTLRITHRSLYDVAAAAAFFTLSTSTLRRNSAAASGSTVLMNIPEPSSNPATRVSRGITLRYQ